MLDRLPASSLQDRAPRDPAFGSSNARDSWASQLARTLAPLVITDGFSDTAIDGVKLIASECSHPRTPLIYEPGLFVIAQGDKVGYLGDRVIHYGPGNYLVQAMPLPFECETLTRPDAPLLGLSIGVDPLMLSELVHHLPAPPPLDRGSPELMAAVALDAPMAEAVQRLASCLQDEHASRALGAKASEDANGLRGQYELFREYALGNFRDFLIQVSQDPAMVAWLDGDTNVKANPQFF